MPAQLINQECDANQLCVQLDRPANPNILDLQTRAYRVDYEYFPELAQGYVDDGNIKTGSIVSQMNLNPAQRIALATGQYGMAAVLMGSDNHTSVFATDLKVEIDGVKPPDQGSQARYARSSSFASSSYHIRPNIRHRFYPLQNGTDECYNCGSARISPIPVDTRRIKLFASLSATVSAAGMYLVLLPLHTEL